MKLEKGQRVRLVPNKEGTPPGTDTRAIKIGQVEYITTCLIGIKYTDKSKNEVIECFNKSDLIKATDYYIEIRINNMWFRLGAKNKQYEHKQGGHNNVCRKRN